MANRSCQSASGDAGLDGVDGALGAEALLQAQRKPSRCHDRVECVGGEGLVAIAAGDLVLLSYTFKLPRSAKLRESEEQVRRGK